RLTDHSTSPNMTPLVTRLSFFFTDPAPTESYTLSLHDALPIYRPAAPAARPGRGDRQRLHRHARREAPPDGREGDARRREARPRSEEHTSELQSRFDLVCRLLLEKKKDPGSPDGQPGWGRGGQG